MLEIRSSGDGVRGDGGCLGVKCGGMADVHIVVKGASVAQLPEQENESQLSPRIEPEEEEEEEVEEEERMNRS